MRRFLLVGLTGGIATGKSTVGRQIATQVGVPFVDLDQAIEDRTGRSVSQLFVERGEAGFRALEREALELDEEVLARAHGRGLWRKIAGTRDLARRATAQ